MCLMGVVGQTDGNKHLPFCCTLLPCLGEGKRKGQNKKTKEHSSCCLLPLTAHALRTHTPRHLSGRTWCVAFACCLPHVLGALLSLGLPSHLLPRRPLQSPTPTCLLADLSAGLSALHCHGILEGAHMTDRAYAISQKDKPIYITLCVPNSPYMPPSPCIFCILDCKNDRLCTQACIHLLKNA